MPLSSSTLSEKREFASARTAIVAAALGQATSGAIRQQLKDGSTLAVVVLVPGPSWIRPVRDLFVARFGAQWLTITADSIKTPQQKSDQSREVASNLAHGQPVAGFAVERDGLPPSLTAAADLTIRVQPPVGTTVRRAIRDVQRLPASTRMSQLGSSSMTLSPPSEPTRRRQRSSLAFANPTT